MESVRKGSKRIQNWTCKTTGPVLEPYRTGSKRFHVNRSRFSPVLFRTVPIRSRVNVALETTNYTGLGKHTCLASSAGINRKPNNPLNIWMSQPLGASVRVIREFKKLLRLRLRLRQRVRYKTIGFNEQTNGLHVRYNFWYIFFCRAPQNNNVK